MAALSRKDVEAITGKKKRKALHDADLLDMSDAVTPTKRIRDPAESRIRNPRKPFVARPVEVFPDGAKRSASVVAKHVIRAICGSDKGMYDDDSIPSYVPAAAAAAASAPVAQAAAASMMRAPSPSGFVARIVDMFEDESVPVIQPIPYSGLKNHTLFLRVCNAPASYLGWPTVSITWAGIDFSVRPNVELHPPMSPDAVAHIESNRARLVRNDHLQSTVDLYAKRTAAVWESIYAGQHLKGYSNLSTIASLVGKLRLGANSAGKCDYTGPPAPFAEEEREEETFDEEEEEEEKSPVYPVELQALQQPDEPFFPLVPSAAVPPASQYVPLSSSDPLLPEPLSGPSSAHNSPGFAALREQVEQAGAATGFNASLAFGNVTYFGADAQTSLVSSGPLPPPLDLAAVDPEPAAAPSRVCPAPIAVAAVTEMLVYL